MNVFLVITTDTLCLNSSIPDYVFTTVSSFESDSFIFFTLISTSSKHSTDNKVSTHCV